MKAINIIGIVVGIISCFLSYFFMMMVSNLVKQAHHQFYNGISQHDVNLSLVAKQASVGIGYMSAVPMVFLLIMFGINLYKIDSQTTKTVSILGLILTILMLVWDYFMISSESRITFNEVGIVWAFYFLIGFVFSIILLVQSNSNKTIIRKVATSDLIDDLEFE